MQSSRSCAHLSDEVVLRTVATIVVRTRKLTARLLACLVEVDVRRLYASEGYPSLHAWCVESHGFSDDEAAKRIHAARAALRYPALLDAVEDGRLHLTAVRLIAPHLTPDNFDELVGAASRQRCAAIEEFLARRFPTEVPVVVPTRVKLLPATSVSNPAPSHDSAPSLLDPPPGAVEHAAGHVLPGAGSPAAEPEHAAGHVPAAPPRYLLQVAISRETHDKLRRAQALLAHSVPPGDVAAVLDKALDALLVRIAKRRHGQADRPKAPRPATPGSRTIPAHVRRAVWARDGGRCTFEGTGGRRCNARSRLEFDHIIPVGRGGVATVDDTRLRCDAHNQLEADRVFGVEFMEAKRAAARARRTQASVPRELENSRGG